MKYLACFLLILLIPATAPAQSDGVIGVYGGYEPALCLLLDDTAGLKTLRVMQFSRGSMSSRFRVEFSPGFTGILMSVTSPYAGVEGDPLTGVTVTYDGSCLTGFREILQLHVMMFGTSAECSWARTAAHPLSIDGMIDTYDCLATRHPTEWAGTHIQQFILANCPDLGGPGPEGPGCLPTDEPSPTASATWGAVKALYR